MTHSYTAEYSSNGSAPIKFAFDDYHGFLEFLSQNPSYKAKDFRISYKGPHQELFNVAKIDSRNLTSWIRIFEKLSFHECGAKLFYLLTGMGRESLDDAVEEYEDVNVYQGDAGHYGLMSIEGYDFWQSMPNSLRGYFDVEQLGDDMILSGDINTFYYEGREYVSDYV